MNNYRFLYQNPAITNGALLVLNIVADDEAMAKEAALLLGLTEALTVDFADQGPV